MTAYLYRMPAGIPGDINRAFAATVMPEAITAYGVTGHPTAYGVPVVIDATSGKVRTMVASDTAVYGVLARPYPAHSSTDAVGTSTPPTQGYCDVLVKGCIEVLLSGSDPAVKGAAVNIWTAVASGAHIQGGWEATAAGGSTIAPTGAVFRGPADTAGNTEIQFNL